MSNILKPILVSMKYFGFGQQLPKDKRKYFIKLMRLLVVLAQINIISMHLVETIQYKSINRFVRFVSIFIKGITPAILMHFIRNEDFMDKEIKLSKNSYRRLKIISYLSFVYLILNTFLYLIIDFVKFFNFETQYIMITLTKTKLDHTSPSSISSFILTTLQFFLFITFPIELSCIYCSVICWIISMMFEELNQQIVSEKFKLIASHIWKIQSKHHRFSGQAFRLLQLMSVPLIFIYIHFVTLLCEFTFHIISFVETGPRISGNSNDLVTII